MYQISSLSFYNCCFYNSFLANIWDGMQHFYQTVNIKRCAFDKTGISWYVPLFQTSTSVRCTRVCVVSGRAWTRKERTPACVRKAICSCWTKTVWVSILFICGQCQINFKKWLSSKNLVLPCVISSYYYRSYKTFETCKRLAPLWSSGLVTPLFFVDVLVDGLVDRALNSGSKSPGFDFHCWSCVEVLDKLLIPHCLCLPGSNGYLVAEYYVWVAEVACILVWLVRCILPGEMRLLKWCVSYTREGKDRLNIVQISDLLTLYF